jgi:DNA-binding XRE family transcriptional regulator
MQSPVAEQITKYICCQMQRVCAACLGDANLMEKTIYTKEYATFLQCFRATRKKAGLTQKQLAEKVEETQSFVSKCERGERRIDVIELRFFCTAMGTTSEKFTKELEKLLAKSN